MFVSVRPQGRDYVLQSINRVRLSCTAQSDNHCKSKISKGASVIVQATNTRPTKEAIHLM